MNIPLRLLGIYRILHVVSLAVFAAWTGFGIFSAAFVHPIPQIAARRIAVLLLACVVLMQGVVSYRTFAKLFSVSLVAGGILTAIYVRFAAFPFIYIHPDYRSDAALKQNLQEFVLTNAIGQSATASEWDQGRFLWFASRGSQDLPPLMFPIIIPLVLMAFNMILRKRAEHE